MSENKELQAQIESGFGEFSWLHLGGECYSLHHGYQGNLELTFKCYDLDVHFRLACPPAFALLLKGSSPTIQEAIAQVEEGLPEWIHLADDPSGQSFSVDLVEGDSLLSEDIIPSRGYPPPY